MKLTHILIILNILVFLLSLTNLPYFIDNFGFIPSRFLAGDYHIIITSMFFHSGAAHLVGNMFALLVLGSVVEKEVDGVKYLSAYILAGVAGSLSLLIPVFGYSPDSIAVGASAAISGLVGLGIFVSPGKFVLFPSIIPLPFSIAGALYLIATVSGLFMPSYIAYSAHLLGFLAGALFGFIWSERALRKLLIFTSLLILILLLPTIAELMLVLLV